MALPTFTPGTEIKAQEMNDALATIFNMVYPVGSIYMSASLSTADAVNAALPGTWQAWGAGRVPVGVNLNDTDFNVPNKTGGSKTVTLTVNQMPEHSHTYNGFPLGTTQNWADPYRKLGYINNSSNPYPSQDGIDSAGGGQPHNNLQPYITCYMYKRIS